jgi:hypothetical protein
VAFRPGELLVRAPVSEAAVRMLAERYPEAGIDYVEIVDGTWRKFTGVPDPVAAMGELRGAGVFSQPNHVLFATGCCPPHPSRPARGDVDANPFLANPFLANPFLANPFLANPFLANPFLANAGGCCSCCAGGAVGANPFLANPFLANGNPAAAPWWQATGRRRSSARPAAAPGLQTREPAKEIRVAILDTGFAAAHQPGGLAGMDMVSHGGDRPDEDGDNFLDPVAGHGTFIAGVIEQLTPGCHLELFEVLTTYGDGDEVEVTEVLAGLAGRSPEERPDLVNLSFGGYSPIGMEVLADAVAALQRVGVVVVASAGNDATCVPTYPAVLPGVVSVGALDEDGTPAAYTNYGPWVRACTRGTDVVSLFFDGFNGAEPPALDGSDDDDFAGWARWSGTSFAAPRVVAALARRMQAGRTAQQAVADLIDDEQLPRIPMLGTVVRP